ncbi:MAG: glucose 1-dehydrogenase [Chitinophagia bacterium]|nr:glucose 1-dehydrogenase [Chitinophagia bacterium]
MAKDPESFELQGRVAVVTGASKGIGRAIARLLGRQGASVVVSSRRQEAVDLTVTALREEGIEASAIAAHMGDPVQVEGLLRHTVERYGGIDIVVNNAAINPVFGPILETDDAVFDKIMQVNVKGPMQLARLAHASMKARGGGSVINISSIEGLTPGHGLGLYSISKASLIAATKVMAREWGPDGIRVNAICPGLVETKFSEALTGNEKILRMVLAKQSLPMIATPEDISGLALFLASGASSFCTGGVFTADGGYTI